MRRILVLLVLVIPLSLAAGQSATQDSARARLLFEQKKYADAATVLETLRREGRSAPDDLVLLGTCYTELNELDKAASALEAAAMIAPGSVALLNARGNLAFARKRFADALELFRQAHRLDPGDRNAAAGMVASLSNNGVELFGQGKVDEARAAFTEALTLDPDSVPALRNAAILELEKGDPGASAQYLERALAISPRDVGLLKLLFLVRNRQGDTKVLTPLLDRLIDVEPGDPEPYAAKGRLLEQDGRKQEALALFRQAVDKGSQDPLPFLRVGEADRNRFLLHDSIGRAVQLISALEIGASQAIGTTGKTGDLKGARLITARIQEVRVTLASSLALLREIDGDSPFADDLARLQSWYPGSVDLLGALGRFYQEKERWPDALTAWQKILKDHPLDEEAQAGAGLAFEKNGDSDRATAAYLRARDLAPQAPELYSALERVYAGKEAELHEVLLDISYRETRNVVLLKELAKVESELGLKADSDKHLLRAREIESAQ